MTEQLSAAEIANRRLHMETIQSVWALFGDNFGSKWSGPMADKDIIKTWARSFYQHGRSDLLAGANALVEDGTDESIPAIPEFRKFVELAKRRREIKELEQGETPAAIKHNKESKAYRRKWYGLCKQIADSPTSREPSDDDVEHFEDSKRNLRLEERWAGGIERLE